LSFKIGCTTFSEHPMAAKKSTPPDASALRVKESSFSGNELSLPMLGAATATQNFHATSISWHAHEGYELLMLLGGGALYEFADGREFELAGGQMLLVPPLHLHRPSQDVRTPSIICAVNFHTDSAGAGHSPFNREEAQWIAAQFQDCGPGMHVMAPALRHMARTLHQMLVQQRAAPRTADAIASMRLLVASILLEAARHTRGTRQRGAANAVALAKEHMENHFPQSLQMNEVAQKAGCSRAHLFLLFKRETGMSPNDWLQRRRVKAATFLLQTTQRKLDDIAAATGFSSAQYCCQVFRKYTGKTPGEHR
jgi:AraC-like DNA-binding protein/mannose-6-phosphate isomerase-like protein (cupin superfamily)